MGRPRSAKVQVRAELTEAEALGGVEFLEGLDIRDPEFEHWIRDQRLHCRQRTARLGDARRRMAVGLRIRRASRARSRRTPPASSSSTRWPTRCSASPTST